MPGSAVGDEMRDAKRPCRPPPDVFAVMLSECLLEFRGYALALARSESVAQDVLQESALKAWKGRDRFLMGSNFRAWFCRIVRNEAITAIRRRKVAADIWAVPEALLATRGGQEDRIEAEDLLRLVHELPPRHKEILALVCGDDLTYHEAAAAMDCTVATVKSRLWRARAEMQKRLFAEGLKLRRRKYTGVSRNASG